MKRKAYIVFKILVFLAVILFIGFVAKESYKTYRDCFQKPADHPFAITHLDDTKDNTLSHYYVDLNGEGVEAVKKGLYATPPFDENGIPITYYGTVGRQYNPTTVAQYAFELWELYIQTNDKQYLDEFLKQADWLVDIQVDGNYYVRFEAPALYLKNPWVSGMYQGQAVSAVLRAYQATGDEKYLKSAESGYQVMMKPLDQGGTLDKTDAGIWFEEYPNPAAPSHVMNGHIWALFGVWDLYRVTGRQDVKNAFDAGVAQIKKDLDKYDNGYWVLYDQRPNPEFIGAHYLDFEIDQLNILYELTGDQVFKDYAERWENYRQFTVSRFVKLVWQRMVTERVESWRKRALIYTGNY